MAGQGNTKGGCACAPTILVVEDDALFARGLARLLAEGGTAAVTIAATCAEALALLPQLGKWCGVIIDVRLPDGDGLDLLEKIRRCAPSLPVLVLTAACDPETVARSKACRARYVVKPPLRGELTDFIDLAVGSQRGFEAALRGAVDAIAGNRATRRQKEALYAIALDDRRPTAALDLEVKVSTLRHLLARFLAKPGADDIRHLGAMIRQAALRADADGSTAWSSPDEIFQPALPDLAVPDRN